MNNNIGKKSKRKFIKSMLALPLLLPGVTMVSTNAKGLDREPDKTNSPAPKISLNAYSFNGPLSKGTMTLEDMLQFCSDKGFLGVDITAYYFPGYPTVPTDDFLYNIKRKAFLLGVEISGTGVRNDFTEPDPVKRQSSVTLVKNWIVAAEKLGAPVIRIFSGNQKPAGHSKAQVLEWMLKDINECIEYGKAHGVIVAVQNHDDFIKTAEDVIQIMEAIKSAWYGLILDTGSYRTADPYDEIARTVKYAVNWQIKEKIFVGGKEVDVDMDKLIGIIKTAGYRGYLPLETLGDGDPKEKIPALLDKIKKSIDSAYKP